MFMSRAQETVGGQVGRPWSSPACIQRGFASGPPSGVAELGSERGTANQDSGAGLVVADLMVVRLTQGPAIMIDRPPPPAAPKSDHPG